MGDEAMQAALRAMEDVAEYAYHAAGLSSAGEPEWPEWAQYVMASLGPVIREFQQAARTQSEEPYVASRCRNFNCEAEPEQAGSCWYCPDCYKALEASQSEEPAGDYWERYEEGIKSAREQVLQEPTQEMCIAAMQAWDEAHKEGVRQWPEMMGRIYKAMLAAAPESPEDKLEGSAGSEIPHPEDSGSFGSRGT